MGGARAYSPEVHGELLDYLRERVDISVDALLHGVDPYFKMRDEGILIPRSSFIRVDQVTLPDIGYIVTDEYMLQRAGPLVRSMSLRDAEGGDVHDPRDALKEQFWSIDGLDLGDW